MSKKRREKVKAKQRRHSESTASKPDSSKPASPPPSQQAAAKQAQPSSARANTQQLPQVNPQIIENKHIQHAAPIWKNFYKAVSETAYRA